MFLKEKSLNFYTNFASVLCLKSRGVLFPKDENCVATSICTLFFFYLNRKKGEEVIDLKNKFFSQGSFFFFRANTAAANTHQLTSHGIHFLSVKEDIVCIFFLKQSQTLPYFYISNDSLGSEYYFFTCSSWPRHFIGLPRTIYLFQWKLQLVKKKQLIFSELF